MNHQVVVIGGGIAGLAAAHRLATADPSLEVTLLESGHRLGGRIRTVDFAGIPLDVGPEALLARMPAAISLCRELGLGHDLVAPAPGPAYVWSRRALRPLPPGLLAGMPGGVGSLLASRILSPAGLLRAGLDLVMPGRGPDADESVGELVRRRLGGQVLERLIDPLLGGIHAGECDGLSVRAVAPHLAAAASKRHSLLRGLRANASGGGGGEPGPTFLTLRGGLEQLVATLAHVLAETGVDVRLSTPVTALEQDIGGGTRIQLAGGDAITADAVVLAAPAGAAVQLLAHASPAAAAPLAAVRSASVAVVALAYLKKSVVAPPGSGFLVARDESLPITACTWTTAKWEHLADNDLAVMKCSIGRIGDDEVLARSDEELIELARSSLDRTLHLRSVPVRTLVVRHDAALPQYAVGHLERVAEIEAALARDLPGVALAGNAYRGAGVPSCIAGGQAAADGILAGLRHAPLRAVTPAR